MWVTSSSETALTPTAIALGNFDGLHLGHRRVIQPILNPTVITPSLITPLGRIKELVPHEIEAYLREKPESLYPTVVTFDPHPQEFFSGQSKNLLTPPSEKVSLLKTMGVKQLVLLPFDRELAQLSPPAFVEEILIKQLRAFSISVGSDFRFGYKREGNAEDLRTIAGNYGIDVTIVPLFTDDGERVSSSVIREALERGNIQRANHLLGRSYPLIGTVIEGQKLARTLGFPTANLRFPSEKFLPRFGVYAAQVELHSDGFSSLSSPVFGHGVVNIGVRPTVQGTLPTVEVHLFDWEGDLYGKTLVVYLQEFLRSEQKFASLDALKQQIQTDCQRAQQILKNCSLND